MANSVFISLPDQISASTPIVIAIDVTISHKPVEEGGDQIIPEELRATEGDYLKITAINAEFELELDSNCFEPSGEITIKANETIFVKIIKISDNIEIPYKCRICPIPPIEGQKKIIVKYAGETEDLRLRTLLGKITLLKDVISKRINP